MNCSASRKGAEWCATYPGCLFGAGVRRISIQVHGEDLFKHGHVRAVGARGRPHWPRYGRNGRSYLRCSIRPDGKEPVHTENGAGGDDGYGAESLNVAAEGQQHRFASSTGANTYASLSQKARYEPPSRSTAWGRGIWGHEAGRSEITPVLTSGSQGLSISLHRAGEPARGARGGAVGDNSGAHFGLAGTTEFGGRH